MPDFPCKHTVFVKIKHSLFLSNLCIFRLLLDDAAHHLLTHTNYFPLDSSSYSLDNISFVMLIYFMKSIVEMGGKK